MASSWLHFLLCYQVKQRPHQDAPGERDLERVAGQGLRISQLRLGRSPKHVPGGWCAAQHRLGPHCTPGSGCHAAQGETHIADRSEEHTSELQSHSDLVCRLLLEKKKKHDHHVARSIHVTRTV